MQRAVVVLCACVMLLSVSVQAADSRSYERPIGTVWDHAVKAVRDVDFVLIDSNRSEHEFTMRTKSKLTHKKGLVMEVKLSGDHTHASITVRAADPEKEEKAVKHIAAYLDALDQRLG